jgi:hypothetical protein
MVIDSRANGVASVNGVLDLGDTTPETFDVRLDGEIKHVYITTHRRYPKTIAAELDDARREWQDSRTVLPDEPAPNLVQIVRDVLGAAELEDQADEEDVRLPRELLRSLQAALDAHDAEPQYKPNWPAWEHYLNKAITLLGPGITYTQADNMDAEKRFALLLRSGYVSLNEVGGQPQNPPEMAPPSTGEKLVPDSPASTT